MILKVASSYLSVGGFGTFAIGCRPLVGTALIRTTEV